MNPKLKYIGMFVAGIAIGCAVTLLLLYIDYRQTSRNYTQIDDSFKKAFIEMNLYSITQKIEFFRLLNGRYPTDLSELRQSNQETSMYIDPYARNVNCIYEFYYYSDKSSDNYLLRSPGKDQTLFTEDDILPVIDKEKLSNLGLLIVKNKNANYPDIKCYEKD